MRAVGYLIGKVPGRALDEMLALGSFVAHPGRLRDSAGGRPPSIRHQGRARLFIRCDRPGGAACRLDSTL